MSLKQTKSRGFTIVELLIVIVVIAILAAITIVAYNGIQNRAKTSAGQAAANALMKKAEAFNTINSVYPGYCQFVTNSMVPTGTATSGAVGMSGCVAGGASAGAEPKLDSVAGVSVASTNVGGSYTTAVSNGNTVVGYFSCAAGANVFYYDYTPATPTVQKQTAGAGC
jgi:prepilin-type N-terminal cleavage/methylation domain-containing protein